MGKFFCQPEIEELQCIKSKYVKITSYNVV